MNIVIADDDIDLCNDLNKFLSRLNHNVTNSNNGKEALELIKNNNFDIALIDINMPVISGIELVKNIKKSDIKIICVLMSGKSEIIQSINSLDLGVFDFLVKPFNLEDLIKILENCLKFTKSSKENKTLSLIKIIDNLNNKIIIDLDNIRFLEDYKFNNENNIFESVCFCSESMNQTYNKIKKLNQYPDLPVLIEGETGTGKEIIARIIHYDGQNKNEPFIAVNCATINKELFEAEIFGYKKGAFTGANPDGKSGFIELAGKGTLFLDEISELGLETQAKLLRVIQEKEYFKLGGTKNEIVNARIICATNMNIEELVLKKIFREDLYYRLSLAKIKLSNLSEKKEEIISLTIFFIKYLNHKLNKNITKIESQALKKLYDYYWPGNIRELKNVITNAMIFNNTKIIKAKDLQLSNFKIDNNIKDNKGNMNIERINKNNLFFNNFDLPDESFNLEDHIKKIIKKTLEKFNGNKSKTAKYLGLTRTQLYNRYKIK